MQLTEHFSLNEFIFSETVYRHKLANYPSEEVKAKLFLTAAGMERIRALLDNKKIKVLSGYRCFQLNEIVGGSKGSQHMLGEACDFVCPSYGSPVSVVIALRDKLELLGIDQLILESSWIHVSFSLRPRHQCLLFKDGKYFNLKIAS